MGHRAELLDSFDRIVAALTPAMRAGANDAIHRVRSFVDRQAEVLDDGALPSVDRSQLDTIRGILDELSGKPTKTEAIAALAAISDLIGAGEISDDDAGGTHGRK